MRLKNLIWIVLTLALLVKNADANDWMDNGCFSSLACQSSCMGCGQFFVEGDLLYWTTREDGVAFAISGLENFLGVLVGPGTVKNLERRWNTGFRVGAGYLFPCSCWDIYADYIRFFNKSHGFNSAPNGVLFTTFGPPFGEDLENTVNADKHLRYQIADIELGFTFAATDFYFRPFAGVRGAWIHETYDIFYFSISDDFSQSVFNKQYFKGVGPRIGFDDQWFCFNWLGNCFPCVNCIVNGLNLFADAAVSLLWGHFNVSRRDIVNGTAVVDTADHFDTVKPLFEVRAGVGWDNYVNWCFLSRIFVQAAFECHLFLKHNQMIRFFDVNFPGTFANINGDLSLYGLTVTGGVIF